MSIIKRSETKKKFPDMDSPDKNTGLPVVDMRKVKSEAAPRPSKSMI
jgi:hypothetical protein